MGTSLIRTVSVSQESSPATMRVNNSSEKLLVIKPQITDNMAKNNWNLKAAVKNSPRLLDS